MPDYSKGQIYTVRCYDDISLIYVGSSVDFLSKRFYNHKKDNTCSLYQYVNEVCNGNWEKWYIELYELYRCNSKQELNRREGEVQREIATINKRIAGRTQKEYRQDKADIIQEKKKIYYQQNVDKINENRKQYYEENAENIKEYQSQYRQNNVDKLKEQKKQYRTENDEKIKKQKQLYYLKKKQEKEASIIK